MENTVYNTRLISKTVLGLFFVSFLLSCQSQTQNSIEIITAEQLKKLVQDEVLLVDVRTPREYEQGRIPQAQLINVRGSDFGDKVNELDKSKPVIVYCAVGGRSSAAASQLQDFGFEQVYNYKGGFRDWQSRGEAIEN